MKKIWFSLILHKLSHIFICVWIELNFVDEEPKRCWSPWLKGKQGRYLKILSGLSAVGREAVLLLHVVHCVLVQWQRDSCKMMKQLFSQLFCGLMCRFAHRFVFASHQWAVWCKSLRSCLLRVFISFDKLCREFPKHVLRLGGAEQANCLSLSWLSVPQVVAGDTTLSATQLPPSPLPTSASSPLTSPSPPV